MKPNAFATGSPPSGRPSAGTILRKLAPTGIHKKRVDLMIDEAVHFQNSPTQNPAVAQDAFLQFLHVRLLEQNRQFL